jgi:ABC-2 type transport system ATP-binding protein
MAAEARDAVTAGSSDVAIRLERLSKTYVKRRTLQEIVLHPFRKAERVEGLREVDLQVPRGSLFGLLGPNGAGKTTLLKILAGLILPSEGTAIVLDHDVATEDRQVKALLGFVTADERSFYWRLSGEDNLIFFARLFGQSEAEARRRSRELIATMELQEVAKRQFLSYSSGMKQRLGIARALLHDPPILCLDEPTRSLDPIAAKHLRRFISEVLNRERGKTIVLATHNLQEAEALCDRLAVLHHGRVLREGRLADLTTGGGQEEYRLDVRGLAAVPADPRWTLAAAPSSDGLLRFTARVAAGGGLSDLLRRILDGGGTVVACTRTTSGLQEIFDRVEAETVEAKR